MIMRNASQILHYVLFLKKFDKFIQNCYAMARFGNTITNRLQPAIENRRGDSHNLLMIFLPARHRRSRRLLADLLWSNLRMAERHRLAVDGESQESHDMGALHGDRNMGEPLILRTTISP